MSVTVETMSFEQVILFLKNHQFAELNDFFGAIQKEFESGQLSEEVLDQVFDMFDFKAPDFDADFAMWIQTFPESHVAHVANAIYFVAQAWRVRGHGTSDTINKDMQKGMKHYLGEAERLARASWTLTSIPLLGYLSVGKARHTYGNDLTLEQVRNQQYPDWYQKGIAQYPNSRLLRLQMLHTFSTHWGGSSAHMAEFVDQQRHLPEPMFRELQARYHGEVAHYAFHFSKKKDEALLHISKAAEISEDFKLHQIMYLEEYKKLPELKAALLEYLNNAIHDPEEVIDERLMSMLVSTLQEDVVKAREVYGILLRYSEKDVHYVYALLGQLAAWHPSLVVGNQTAEYWYRLGLEVGATTVGQPLVDLWMKDKSLSKEEVFRKVHQAAEKGATFCKVLMWEYFDSFKKLLNLSDEQKYHALITAVQHGDAHCKEQLIKLLRKGKIEFRDRRLNILERKVKPEAASLQLAQSLADELKQAAETTSTPVLQWKYINYFSGASKTEPEKKNLSFRFWWLGFLVLWIILRLVDHAFRGPS